MGVVLRQACSESQWTVSMGYLTISINVRRYQTHHRWHFFFQKDNTLVHMHYACNTTQSNSATLSTSFLLNHAPNSADLNAVITRFRESYSSVSMSYESKKIEEIKQWLVEIWQCTNTAFEWKWDFCVSEFCQVVQKHKLLVVVQ